MYFNIKANDLQFRCTKLGKWCKKQWITHRLFHYSWTEVLIFVYQRRVESHDLRNILCWKSIANQLSRSNLGFQTGRHDLNFWRIFMEIHIFYCNRATLNVSLFHLLNLKLNWHGLIQHYIHYIFVIKYTRCILVKYVVWSQHSFSIVSLSQ